MNPIWNMAAPAGTVIVCPTCKDSIGELLVDVESDTEICIDQLRWHQYTRGPLVWVIHCRKCGACFLPIIDWYKHGAEARL